MIYGFVPWDDLHHLVAAVADGRVVELDADPAGPLQARRHPVDAFLNRHVAFHVAVARDDRCAREGAAKRDRDEKTTGHRRVSLLSSRTS